MRNFTFEKCTNQRSNHTNETSVALLLQSFGQRTFVPIRLVPVALSLLRFSISCLHFEIECRIIQTLNTFLYTQPKETAASKLLEEDGIELDIDLGEDADVNAETALKGATTAEIVDLAGILGLHSMMNQVRPRPALCKTQKFNQTQTRFCHCRIRLCCESRRIPFENLICHALIETFHLAFQDQFHSAQSDKWADKADPAIGWNGVTKATPLKQFPEEAPNKTNPDVVVAKLKEGDKDLDKV